MALKLSICIATTSARSEIIKPLLNSLSVQIDGKEDLVEVIIDPHETNCIGKKRNDMLKRCRGEYQTSVDSDDHIAHNYVDLILESLRTNPDCVAINGKITFDGLNEKKWYISKEFGHWKEVNGIYYRTPNHISPIRTVLALSAGFPEVSFAEDHAFSMRVLPYLKTESTILQPIYHYDYSEQKLRG